jgi:acyl carrier protein
MDKESQMRVYKILKKVTGRDYNTIDLNEDLSSQLTLDSIQIVELFASLEEEFNIELPLSMMTVRSGNAFFSALEEQLKKQL